MTFQHLLTPIDVSENSGDEALEQHSHIAHRVHVDRVAQAQTLLNVGALVVLHQIVENLEGGLDLVTAHFAAGRQNGVLEQIDLVEGERLQVEGAARRPDAVDQMRIAFARPRGQSGTVAGAPEDDVAAGALVGALDFANEQSNVGQRLFDGEQGQTLEGGVAGIVENIRI